MPPPAAKKSVLPVEEDNDVFDADGADFFEGFDIGEGPSARKKQRLTAKREEQTGKTLDEEAMDPVISANEARKKIANIVRARAGVAPTAQQSHFSGRGKHQQRGNHSAGVTNGEQQTGRASKQDKVEAKFARKAERKSEAVEASKKYKRVLRKGAKLSSVLHTQKS